MIYTCSLLPGSNFFHFHADFRKNLAKQECIKGGCVRSTAVAGGGAVVSAWGVSAQGGVCPGVCLPRRVSAQAGVWPGGRRCLPGGCLPRGVCPGGVYLGECLHGGVYPSMHWAEGVCPSTCWDTHIPPVDRILDTRGNNRFSSQTQSLAPLSGKSWIRHC